MTIRVYTAAGAKLARLGSSASSRFASSSAALSPALETLSATPSGVKIASIEGPAPAASVSLVVRAGSRFEAAGNNKEQGAAHYLKAFGFKNTKARSAFRVTREAELQGGSLSATLSRDAIVYTAECLREDVPYFASVLADIAQETRFAPHEFTQLREFVHFEAQAAKAEPLTAIVDAAHKVAFRTGLGNSLFVSPENDHVTLDSLMAYAERAFNPANVALIGTGVAHSELTAAASAAFGEAFAAKKAAAAVAEASAKYHGGQLNIERDVDVAQYLLAFPTGAASPEAVRVLAALLGGETHVKWGAAQTPLGAAAEKAGPGASIGAFALPSNGAGLLAVHVTATPAKIADAVRAAASQIASFASGSVAASQLRRAINAARVEAGDIGTQRQGQIEHLTARVSGAQKATIAESVAALESVSAADVAALAKSAFSSKPTAVGYGYNLPYADTLGL
ncbi:LuxS/MPP-like metallohydrolase [Ramicandelaber brevisporus]|nr:LuxS/MPP-like metallohydrolase [Ramicandelaber brevisporus]